MTEEHVTYDKTYSVKDSVLNRYWHMYEQDKVFKASTEFMDVKVHSHIVTSGYSVSCMATQKLLFLWQLSPIT